MQEKTIPLVAIDFAFEGGANQDPVEKPGVGDDGCGLARRGRGRSRCARLPGSRRPQCGRADFPRATRLFARQPARAARAAGYGRRSASPGADRAALRCRADRPHPRADADAPAARDHQSERYREPHLVAHGFPRSSLRAAAQRLARIRAADRARRPDRLHAPRLRPRPSQDRRGRRHRRGDACAAARSDFRRAAGKGRSPTGAAGDARLGRAEGFRRARRAADGVELSAGSASRARTPTSFPPM